MEISERLQQLRKDSNYSQEQLADMLGVSRQAISKWESGQANPDLNNIIKLTQIYNVSADYILMGKETVKEPTKSEPPIKGHSPAVNKTLSVISIIGATALIGVLFIVLLAFFTKTFLAG